MHVELSTRPATYYFVAVSSWQPWSSAMQSCRYMPTHYITVGNILQRLATFGCRIGFDLPKTKLLSRIPAVRLKTYLVEDNPTIRENLIATLEELVDIDSIGTAESENQAKAWLLANPQGWDLAILDLFLKQGSGLGVLAACKDRNPSQKVVVLSNYATADIRHRCAQLGVDAVFDKSNEIDGLVEFCMLQAGAARQ